MFRTVEQPIPSYWCRLSINLINMGKDIFIVGFCGPMVSIIAFEPIEFWVQLPANACLITLILHYIIYYILHYFDHFFLKKKMKAYVVDYNPEINIIF